MIEIIILSGLVGFLGVGWYMEYRKSVAVEKRYQEMFEIISMKLGELKDREKYGK